MINETKESQYIKIGNAEDISIGKAKRINVSGNPVAVFHLEDGFHAIEDTCSHAGASLSFGQIVDGHVVACSRHGAHFDIKTGRVVSLPAVRGVRCYEVKLEDGQLFVGEAPIPGDEPAIISFEDA